MYEQLSQITKKYGNEFYLKQSMHPFTTQTNEALNYSQACLTPKTKSFHESSSFHYRHAIVIGCHNLGYANYWKLAFDRIGILYSQYFEHHLSVVENKKIRWKGYRAKQEVKRRRAYRQEATERRLLYENRTAEYGAGIGLDIGNNDTPAVQNVENANNTGIKKCRCGSITHLRTSSHQCRLNPRNIVNVPLCEETKEESEEVLPITSVRIQGELHPASEI